MRRLETEPLQSYGGIEIDAPQTFEVQSKLGALLTYQEVLAQTPAITSSYDGHDSPQLALRGESDLPIWDEEADYSVGRLSGAHVRNLEILSPHVEVVDSFGNVFNSLCVKGSNFSNPHIFDSATASRKYIIFGLQESLIAGRIIAASRMMRKHNIGTEYICGLVVPKKFPLVTDKNNFDAHESIEFADFYEQLATKFAVENPDGRTAIERKQEMLEKFADCEYVITYRGMDIPYRMSELNNPATFSKIKQFIKDKSIAVPVDIETCSVDDYLEHIVAPNLADNIAKLHEIGLVHNFPYGGNVSALGSLVDTDSCRGEPLGIGDPKITDDDIYHEVMYACTSLIEATPLLEVYTDSDVENARHARIFLSRYMTHRFGDDEEAIKEFLVHMLDYKLAHRDDERIHFDMLNTGPFMASQLVLDVLKNLNIDIQEDDTSEDDENPKQLWDQFIAEVTSSPLGILPRLVLEKDHEYNENPANTAYVDPSVISEWVRAGSQVGHAVFLRYVIGLQSTNDFLDTLSFIHGEKLDYSVQREGFTKTERMSHDLALCLIPSADLIYFEKLDTYYESALQNIYKTNPENSGLLSRKNKSPVPVVYLDYENLESAMGDWGVHEDAQIEFKDWDSLSKLVEACNDGELIALSDLDTLDEAHELLMFEPALWNFVVTLHSARPKLFVHFNKNGETHIYSSLKTTWHDLVPVNGDKCDLSKFMNMYQKLITDPRQLMDI